MRAYFEGLVILILGLTAVIGIWSVPAANDNETWAGIVPFGAGLGLLIISFFMLFGSRQDRVDNPEYRREHGSTKNILILFLLALLYQQSIRWFGYILPTAIASPIVLYMFGVRSRIGLTSSIVLCPLIYHIIFFEFLGVFPPFGEVFDILDVIRG